MSAGEGPSFFAGLTVKQSERSCLRANENAVAVRAENCRAEGILHARQSFLNCAQLLPIRRVPDSHPLASSRDCQTSVSGERGKVNRAGVLKCLKLCAV